MRFNKYQFQSEGRFYVASLRGRISFWTDRISSIPLGGCAVFTLQEVTPEIAAKVDYMNNVVIFGPEDCPRCDRTAKLLDAKGIKWIKHVVEDSGHPLIVALKAHLRLEPTDLVPMPMVFVNGEFRWHDINPVEISKLAKSFALAV